MQDIYWTGSAVTPGPITAPDDPAQCTGYLVCYDEDGNVEAGVSISIRQTAASQTTGYAFDTATRSEVSDANGLVQFTGLWQGATYHAWRGTSETARVSVTIPAAATYALPVILGQG
jgi:hypothetical protein